jgi:hypothetical protein
MITQPGAKVSNLQRSEIILIAAALGPMRSDRCPVLVAACGLLEVLTPSFVARFGCFDKRAPHGRELNRVAFVVLLGSIANRFRRCIWPLWSSRDSRSACAADDPEISD